jgi:hypothetical protein
MKPLLVLVFQLLTVVSCAAAAPEKVDGSVYYESYALIGVGTARSFTSFAIVLNSDGTYSGLFNSLTVFFGGPYLTSQPDGTYSYRKIDDQTAELSLTGIPQNFTGSIIRTLKFSTDTSGSIPSAPGDFFTFSHNFRIAPLGSPPPLVNCSNRSFVRAGGMAFTGFVVAGGSSRAVLVRAAGPSLASFSITDALGNPRLTVVNAATNAVFATNDDWGSDPNAPGGFSGRADTIKRTSALVGAFPLVENSKDAAVILTLAPGAYIAQVSSPEASDSGQALIEVYLLP